MIVGCFVADVMFWQQTQGIPVSQYESHAICLGGCSWQNLDLGESEGNISTR